MGDKTSIEWTDATWNPVTGCTKVSQGCKNCYAERVFLRAYHNHVVTDKNGFSRYREFTDVQTHPARLDQPLRWKKPRRIFVNSMSDLFHEDVPVDFIVRVFEVMSACPQHQFQVLTKRPGRIGPILYGKEGGWYLGSGDLLPNVWLGISAEDQATADERIPILFQTPAAVRFASLEPLLGPIDLFHVKEQTTGLTFNAVSKKEGIAFRTSGLDWVIVGGESGPGARPCNVQWIRDIIAQCRAAGAPCFVKQLGAYAVHPPDKNGASYPLCLRDRKGGDWNEWPADLRVREYPA
jgi:protein gp37